MDPNVTPLSTAKPEIPKTGYKAVRKRAGQAGRVVALLFAILLIGSGVGYFIAQSVKTSSKTPTTPQIKTLSPDEISKLSAQGSNLGTSNQLLTIAATTQFNNDVIISKDLSLTGKLNANGPVNIRSLTVGDLTLGGNLAVVGSSVLQKGATVGQLLAVNGNLTVSGIASLNTLNVTNITVKNLAITGPLVISHLSTQGQLPLSSTGGAVGGGGTSSLSGNDAAGTININIGSGPTSGALITITFRAAYPGNVHVLLSPLSGAAASAPVYISRTSTGFQLRTDSALTPGSLLSYDYLVVQ